MKNLGLFSVLLFLCSLLLPCLSFAGSPMRMRPPTLQPPPAHEYEYLPGAARVDLNGDPQFLEISKDYGRKAYLSFSISQGRKGFFRLVVEGTSNISSEYVLSSESQMTLEESGSESTPSQASIVLNITGITAILLPQPRGTLRFLLLRQIDALGVVTYQPKSFNFQFRDPEYPTDIRCTEFRSIVRKAQVPERAARMFDQHECGRSLQVTYKKI